MTDAVSIRQDILSRKTTATEVAERFLSRIEAIDPKVRAFLSVNRPAALAQARKVDEKIARGGKPGLLAGLPVAVKDNLCTADAPTTCGSKILEGYRPPYDATVVRRLREEDAVIVGKTNLDEFAMGSSTENSAFFTSRNPWNLQCVPGGSSGGSAAAVAAGMAPLALGSDTGGSIRQPAALCGVTGLKPTYGRVSRYGLVAFGSSLDQIGTVGHTVEDAARLLGVVAGSDPHDATSLPHEVEDYVEGIDDWDPRGARIGWPHEYFGEGLDPAIRTACEAARDRLAEAGAEVVEVSLPHASYGIAVYYVVAIAEASSNLARYDGVRYGYRAADAADLQDMYLKTRAAFGAEVKRRIMLGTYVLSAGYYEAFYGKGTAVRARIAADFDRAWTRVDAILTPTTPTPAFELGEKVDDPLAMYLNDIYTVSANLALIPAISIPWGTTPAAAGRPALPIGIQLMGPRLAERSLFRMARFLEREAPSR